MDLNHELNEFYELWQTKKNKYRYQSAQKN